MDLGQYDLMMRSNSQCVVTSIFTKPKRNVTELERLRTVLIRPLITTALIISSSSCAVLDTSAEHTNASKHTGAGDSTSISIDYEILPDLEELIEQSEIAVRGVPVEVKQVERWHEDQLFQSTLYVFDVDESFFGSHEAKQITVM